MTTPDELPNPDELRTKIGTYVDTINGRDPEAIAALFAEDGVQADPASNPPNVGRAAIARFFTDSIGASDNWHFTAAKVHTCANQVAINFSIAVETGGATMTITGIEVFTVDAGGLFSSVYAYWDGTDLTVV